MDPGWYSFDELIAAMTSGVKPTDKQKAVIRFIQKIQAFLSVSKGITTLGMNITHNGTYFYSDGTNFSRQEQGIIKHYCLYVVHRYKSG